MRDTNVRHLSVASGLCDLLLIHGTRKAKVDAWLKQNTDLGSWRRLLVMAYANAGHNPVIRTKLPEAEAMRLAEDLASRGATAGIRATV